MDETTAALQEANDKAGMRWAKGGHQGAIPAGAFPLWASPQCRHPEARLRPDGASKVCMDCGRIRVTS